MKYALVISLAICITGCATKESLLKPFGTTSLITNRDNSRMEAELLAVWDSALVIQSSKIVQTVPFSSIWSVEVSTRDPVRPWLWWVVVGQGLPTIIVALAAEDKGWGALGGAVTGLTALLFELSEPQRKWNFPISPQETERLRLHTRFSAGLTDEQFQGLLHGED